MIYHWLDFAQVLNLSLDDLKIFKVEYLSILSLGDQTKLYKWLKLGIPPIENNLKILKAQNLIYH